MKQEQGFSTQNPSTEERLESYSFMGLESCRRMGRDGARAFSGWRKLDFSQRGELLRALGRTLRADKDRLARSITLEMGKPIRQSEAEVEKCAWTAEVVAKEGAGWLADEEVRTDAKRSLVRFEPMGVILGVEPWNFPAWQALRFAIPTLMAGNTVLLRPSAVVPGTSLLLENALSGAGFPPAVFRTILTPHELVGDVIASQFVTGVAFTGSNEAGADVAAAAGRNAKKCVLELGGSDPFIVLEDADVTAAAKAGAESRLINSGQSCINAKRFIIVDAVYEEFKELFVKEMSSRVVGDPMDPKTDVGPLVRSSQLEEVESQVDDAVRKGAKVLCGGKRIPTRGYYYEPTVLEGCSAEMKVLRDEVFGPVAPLINAKGDQEAVALANETRYGLGASVWTRDGGKAMAVGLAIEAGVIFVNGAVKSDPRMPFGGVKASGYGREISRQGIREFTNVKGLNLY